VNGANLRAHSGKSACDKLPSMNSDVAFARQGSAIEPKSPNFQRHNYSSARFHLLVFLVAFLIIFSRRPDVILHAQFFAEDGKFWYAQAYQFGSRSLFFSVGGYLHVVARLIAMLALLFPFSLAPLAISICVIGLQALPVNLFLSARFSRIALSTRLLGSFIYLGLPNSYGVSGKAATVQWHLAVLACLVLLAEPSSSPKWRLFSASVLVALSIESPLGLLFIPLAAVLWWIRRNRSYAISVALLIPGTVLQVVVMLFSRTRQIGANGSSIGRLLSILGRQVFLPPFVGRDKVLRIVLHHSPGFCFALEFAATLMGLAVLVYVLRDAPLELKLFIVFSFAVLALSLARPLAGTPDQPQWEWLRFPGTSNRYFYFPIMAFMAALLWMFVQMKSRRVRWIGGLLLLASVTGIRRDWRYPALPDMHFKQYVAEFTAAPAGTKIVIPITPVPWTMELTKN
jgi:hypothetical protein